MVSCDFLKVVFTVVSFYIFSWGYWLSHVDTVVAKGWWWGCQFQDHWAIDAWRIFDGWYGCANIKMGHTTIEMAILITLIGTMWKNCDWPVDCFRQSHMVWYTPCMCCLLYTWFCRSRMFACVCVLKLSSWSYHTRFHRNQQYSPTSSWSWWWWWWSSSSSVDASSVSSASSSGQSLLFLYVFAGMSQFHFSHGAYYWRIIAGTSTVYSTVVLYII